MKNKTNKVLRSKFFEVVLIVIVIGIILDFAAYPLLTKADTLFNLLGFLILAGIIIFSGLYIRERFTDDIPMRPKHDDENENI